MIDEEFLFNPNSNQMENIHGFNDKVKGLKSIISSNRPIRSVKTNEELKTVYDIFKYIVDDFIDKEIRDSIKDNYERGVNYKSHIKSFIDMIDKSNAASAIGTLEFLDQIAKFNTVDVICKKEKNELGNIEQDEYIELYNHLNMKRQNTMRSMGGTKYTKRRNKKRAIRKSKKTERIESKKVK